MNSRHTFSLRSVLMCGVVYLALGLRESLADTKPSLHAEIDRIIAARLGTSNFEPAEDAEFLRRLSLDLTGQIPSAADVRRFCEHESPNKRIAEIDRLLNSPGFSRHMKRVMDGWLMRRLPIRHVTSDEWNIYLHTAVSENKKWDEITFEILKSNGTDPSTRGAARFFLDRECNTDDLVRDIGSIFLGRDIRCAQCHDHPFVSDFKQADYFGLVAFVDRSFLFDDKERKLKFVAEKPDGVTSFTSALTQARGSTMPIIFSGRAFSDPISVTDVVADALRPEGTFPIPAYSRRGLLSVAVVEHPAFGRTLANRLWYTAFGRGIVDPPDQDHADNPPLDPELLDQLTAEIVRMKFDLRAFLKELVLTRLYERAGQPRTPLSSSATSKLATTDLRKLSPDQLAWSWLQATGQIEAQQQATPRESEKTNFEKNTIANAEAVYDRLAADAEKVIKVFTTSLPGESIKSDTTTEQALFLLNGDTLRKWIAACPGNLLDRLQNIGDDETLISEMYLSVLSRYPTHLELKFVRDVLDQSNSDRIAAISDMIEALLTSTEFRFNH